jgi:RHS repeat-associated protein
MNCTDTPSTIGFMAWDYYPFGMLIPNRTYNKIPSCEPVVTNQTDVDIIDEEYTGDVGDWQDGNIAFAAISGELVATAANSNSSVGAGRVYTTVVGEDYTVSFDVTDLSGLNGATLLVYHQQVASGSTFSDITNTADPNPSAITSTGVYTFEFTADEEQSTINLILINSTTGSTFTIDDFIINGTQQIRTFNCTGDNYLAINYRYGFNGMENDNEVSGEGNSNTTPFRKYDSRLGRWLSLDPLMSTYPHQSPYAGFNNNPVFFSDPTGLEGDPPKTYKNECGEVITPNGYGADFAEDWYSIVEGNLVMTNGTDYQAWDQKSGTYVTGRAPINHKGTSNTPYYEIPSDLQIGDTYKQKLYDPYGVNTSVGIFGDSRKLQYLGGDDWVLLDDFSSLKSAEAATWIFPTGGSLKGGSSMLKWLGRFYAGRKVISIALPNSGPIMHGLGAASRAEMLAIKLKMNINSATTRQVLNSLDETVESFISKYRKSSITNEMPGQFMKQTVEEALKSGNTTVRKLLTDGRFVKK